MPNLLLIDDDASIHQLLTFRIEKLGWKVTSAMNGIEGEAMALAQKPDMILLDIMMPKQDGYDTCLHLRSQGYQGAISMISALQEATGIQQSKQRGANGYLIKPIDMSLLEMHLEYALTGMKYPTVKAWLEQTS